MADRRNKNGRDMAITMGVIVVALLVLLGMYGGFSFSPGRPTSGPAPTADVIGGFTAAGSTLGFPVVVPRGLPEDWKPTSFVPPGKSGLRSAARGGWLTPSGAFITLIEAPGPRGDVQKAELGQADPPTGQIDAGGASWSVVAGHRSEMAWIRPTVGDGYLLITGSASAADLQTLAAAVAAG